MLTILYWGQLKVHNLPLPKNKIYPNKFLNISFSIQTMKYTFGFHWPTNRIVKCEKKKNNNKFMSFASNYSHYQTTKLGELEILALLHVTNR